MNTPPKHNAEEPSASSALNPFDLVWHLYGPGRLIYTHDIHDMQNGALHRLQERLAPHGGIVARSREVMRRFGNMSSSTVLFILDSLLRDAPAPGPALLASFGPGFGAHQVLLEIPPAEGRP